MGESGKSLNSSPVEQKLGLALSGGGFRASFFHLGVLARLAELGTLRHIEVISTVSGGSIIGALYYLYLKKLLEEKADNEISDQDYRAIIKQLERDFLKGVERNIIMSIYTNPIKNLKMFFARFSQSIRIGEMYDEIFYKPVLNSADKKPTRLRDLIIHPKAEPTNFYPLKDNMRRKAKVPVLLINATSLNTGRNWRFEASKMGEHVRDDELAQEIDKNSRLLTPRSYDDIPKHLQDYPLGQAVAASACLPGVFNPLPIDGLYPDGMRLLLIDGGVHDNQGIQGLLDLKCTHFIVSDASKQIEQELRPDIRIDLMMQRIRGMLIDRIREEQLFRMLQKVESTTIFIHPLCRVPIKVNSHLGDNVAVPAAQQNSTTPYLIAPQVQRMVARIRTHLDSFTEIEANSLMLAGYRIASVEMAQSPVLKPFTTSSSSIKNEDWSFLSIAPWMAQPTPIYLKHLSVASQRFMKTFGLSRQIGIITLIILLFAIPLSIYGLWRLYALFLASFKLSFDLDITITGADIFILLVAIPIIFLLSRSANLLGPWRTLKELASRLYNQALLPAFVSPVIALHMAIFDPLFIKLGRLDRLGPPPQTDPQPKATPLVVSEIASSDPTL